MGKRKRLGLIFSVDEQWIGGTYYTINLIQALKILPDHQKPEIVAFSTPSDYKRLAQETNYPYLIFELLDERPLPRWLSGANRISSRLLGKKLFFRQYKGQLDALFLFQYCSYLDKVPMERRIYWIPDFQDKYLPQFFTEEGLKQKDEKSRWIAQNARWLILSSDAVLADWNTFYPEYCCRVTVVHFAVTHPPYKHLSIDELRSRYNLPEVYFFSPNQFWAHKNHMVVIKAAEQLKQSGTPVMVVFSGKENDSRNPGYTASLKEYIRTRGLDDVVIFLGFLDRKEQLQIMNYSRAVIQPSKFEGWSTVIEDAMAMDKPVIASGLEVNRHQLGESGLFFEVDDFTMLSKLMLSDLDKPRVVQYDYQEKKMNFAESFLHVMESL